MAPETSIELHVANKAHQSPSASEKLPSESEIAANKGQLGTGAHLFELYLREGALGRKPLTHDEHSLIAERLSEARNAFTMALFSHPASLAYLNRLYDDLINGKVTREEFSFSSSGEDDSETTQNMQVVRVACFLEERGEFRELYKELKVAARSLIRARAANAEALAKCQQDYEEILNRGVSFIRGQGLPRGHHEAMLSVISAHLKGARKGENILLRDPITREDLRFGLTQEELESRFAIIDSTSKRIARYRQELTESGLRFVISIATKYQGRGLDILDLIQEGNIGLMKAVEYFDHRRGVKFMSYAGVVISNTMKIALYEKSRTIRIPQSKLELISRLKRASAELAQELEREPEPEELAEVLELPVKHVRLLLAFGIMQISLDAPLSHDESDSNTIADLIPDYGAEAPDVVVDRKYLREVLIDMLLSLPPDLRRTLELRFGIRGGVELELEQIGKIMGVTKQAIQVRQEKALRLLRNGGKLNFLRSLDMPL